VPLRSAFFVQLCVRGPRVQSLQFPGMLMIPFGQLLHRQAAQDGCAGKMVFRRCEGDPVGAFLLEFFAIERDRVSEHEGGALNHLQQGLRWDRQVVGETIRSSSRILSVHSGKDFAFSGVQGGTDQPFREGHILDQNVQRRNAGERFSRHEGKRFGRCEGDAEPCEGPGPDGNSKSVDLPDFDSGLAKEVLDAREKSAYVCTADIQVPLTEGLL